MTSIFPDVSSGGVVVRTQAGACQNPTNVQQAYCPPATFTTTCDITALPSDCTARFTASQINAFQSELLCLAVAFDPDGTWNCGSLCNLSTAFNNWVTGASDTDLPALIEQALCSAPGGVPVASTRLIACDAAGNILKINPAQLVPDFTTLLCTVADAVSVACTDSLVGCFNNAGSKVTVQLLFNSMRNCAPLVASNTVPSADGDFLFFNAAGQLQRTKINRDSISMRTSFGAPDVIAPAPSAGFNTVSTTAFTIQNPTNRTIIGTLNLHHHSIMVTNAEEGIASQFDIQTIGGLSILSTHVGFRSQAVAGDSSDVFMTNSRPTLIPPGGLALQIVFGVSTNGLAGGDTTQNVAQVTFLGFPSDFVYSWLDGSVTVLN